MSAPSTADFSREDFSTEVFSTKGRHCTGELWGVASERLRDMEGVMALFEELLTSHGFTVVDRIEHAFPGPGGGFTGVFLLSESHASVHTYPEHGYAAIDLFSCGERDPTPPLKALSSHLGVTPQLAVHPRGERAPLPQQQN